MTPIEVLKELRVVQAPLLFLKEKKQKNFGKNQINKSMTQPRFHRRQGDEEKCGLIFTETGIMSLSATRIIKAA
jgi:hypothetical protein